MRKSLSVALLLALAWPAWADPPSLTIPPEVRPAGAYARMLPQTDATSVTYVGIDGLEPIPSELLRDPRLFLMDCYGRPAGRYRFAAVAASKSGEQARADFVLVLGDAPPVPPPGPGPNPPPNPPEPTDPLYLSLRSAWQQEFSMTRAAERDKLAALYAKAVSYAEKPVDKTQGQLIDRVSRAARQEVGEPDKVLPKLRLAIGDYLKQNLTRNPNDPIDPRTADCFIAVAKALEALK